MKLINTFLGLMLIMSTANAANNSNYIDMGGVGQTTSVNTYSDVQAEIDTRNSKMQKDLQNPAFRKQLMAEQTQKYISSMYEINTPELTAGAVVTKEVDYPDLVQAMVLVGCDKYSAEWLQDNTDELKTYNPMIYVVNCSNKLAYEKLKKNTSLAMMPVRASELAKMYDVKHYPILITKKLIIQ